MPHQTKTVAFTLRQKDLAIWNVAGKWVTEPGSFTLWAGGDSGAELTAKFSLKTN
jgi:beta-glucosidase